MARRRGRKTLAELFWSIQLEEPDARPPTEFFRQALVFQAGAARASGQASALPPRERHVEIHPGQLRPYRAARVALLIRSIVLP